MHVQGLFKDAPDLLSEFKDFLPEITGPSAPSGVVGIVPQPPGGPGVSGPSWSQTDNANAASKKPLPPLKRRRKPVEKDTTPVPPAKASANRVRHKSFCSNESLLIVCLFNRLKERNIITKVTRRRSLPTKTHSHLKTAIHTRIPTATLLRSPPFHIHIPIRLQARPRMAWGVP